MSEAGGGRMHDAEHTADVSEVVLGELLEVTLGTLLPQSPKRVVLRLHCPGGKAGTRIPLSATASGTLPDGTGTVGTGTVGADPSETELRLAELVLLRRGRRWRRCCSGRPPSESGDSGAGAGGVISAAPATGPHRDRAAEGPRAD